MSASEPESFTLEALMIALDEDDARVWLEQWRAASRPLKTLMESDVACAALARDRAHPRSGRDRRRFLEIMGGSGLRVPLQR